MNCAACKYEIRTGRAAPEGAHDCDPLTEENQFNLPEEGSPTLLRWADDGGANEP